RRSSDLADLGVLVSNQLYEWVVGEGHSGLAPARFRRVHVKVRDSSATAWLSVAAPVHPRPEILAEPGNPDRRQRQTKNPTGLPLRVLALADEWLPARGGLSAFNRYLCTALAVAEAEVYCVVPEISEQAQADAKEAGVRL